MSSAVIGDRGFTTTVLEYGPGGDHDFSDGDAALRKAVHSHPEERLLTPLGYRLLLGAQVGKTNFDDSPLGVGYNAALELSLRTSLRTELAVMTGPRAYPRVQRTHITAECRPVSLLRGRNRHWLWTPARCAAAG